MAAARQATKPARRHAAPAPRRAPVKEKAPLRVVEAPERVRSVGAMGTLFVVLVFATLFALAETQARIDALAHENPDLQEQLDARVAEEARLDSPDGVRESAAAAGLVEATDVPTLVPVGPGLLAPPVVSDPFGPGVAE